MGEEWINKTRQKMDAYEEPAPKGLWEDIERTISQQQPKPVPLYKRVMLWSTGVAAAAAAIVAVALFVGNDNTGTLPPSVTLQPQLAQQQQATEKTTPTIEASIPQEAKTLLAENRQGASTTITRTRIPQQSVNEMDKPEEKKQEVIQDKRKPRKVSAPQTSRKTAMKNTQDQRNRRPLLSSQRDIALQKKAKRFSVDLYTGNLPHSSTHLNDYSEFVTGTTLPHDFSTRLPDERTPVRDIIYSNLGKEIKTRIKHRLPIKFGLSFRYHFNDRWSLESGLTYTYLSADLTAGTNHHYFDSQQRLQYLGIPLNVNCNIWDNSRWSIYASAGGGIEKCIHGQLETDYILDGNKISSEKKDIMEDELQFSVNGAIGAQFNITKNFGIFAEPGVAYYFDNGSPVETIYKDKPLNFKFKMGLRLTLK